MACSRANFTFILPLVKCVSTTLRICAVMGFVVVFVLYRRWYGFAPLNARNVIVFFYPVLPHITAIWKVSGLGPFVRLIGGRMLAGNNRSIRV